MRFGRQLLAALIALLIIGSGGTKGAPLFPVDAFAEEAVQTEVELAATAVPSTPNLSDEVELTFTVGNRTDAMLTNLRLTAPDGTQTDSLGDLAPSASLSHTLVHTVSQVELDEGTISYMLTCELDGEHRSFPVSAAIRPISSVPEIEFLRRISSREVTDGGRATVVYRVRNVGDAAVYDLTVADPLNDFEATLDQLNPGETRAFINRAVVAGDVVSAPRLTYAATPAGEPYDCALDERPLHAAGSFLDSSLTAGRSLFNPDTAEVILRLSNGGEVDYRNISVYDDIYGGVIADSIQLPTDGEPVEVARSYPLRGDGSYRWRIIGENAAGDRIDFVTETLSVPDERGTDVLLKLSATASTTRINRSGYVPFVLELTNIGSAMASNVQLTEETLGEIGELAVVPTGDPTRFEARLEVTEDATFTFYASYVDPMGQQRVASSEPIEITIGPGGTTPEREDAAGPLFEDASSQMGDTSLFVGLLVGSIGVLIVLILVLLVTSRRARKQRKERTAARKQRVREATPKANRIQRTKK